MIRELLQGPAGGRAPSLGATGAIFRRAGALLLVGALVACGEPSPIPGDSAPPSSPAAGSGAAVSSLVARSASGVVVSGAPLASRAGVEILEAGGNAVDAAVATAFALGVVEPTQSGLGGRTQGLVVEPDGTAFGIDATTEVPASYDPDNAPDAERGHVTVAIPGTVAGLVSLHERGGRLPLEQVMAPAIRLARDGFVLGEGEAGRLAGVRDVIAADPGASTVFLRSDGRSLEAGDRLVLRDLAAVLEGVAADRGESFYRGEVARAMVADVADRGGYLTLEDLERYAARDAIVVRGRYRDLDLIGTYLPASGATAIEALQILERLPPAEPESPSWVASVATALLAAFEDREAASGEPAEDAARLTSVEWAERRAAELGSSPPTAQAPSTPPEPAHTTHLSVVDGEGRMVAMTQSLGPTMGSGVVTPGLGFPYAATLAGYLGYVRPGERAWSSQAPLVAFRDGASVLVIGGAGARRILSALVSVVDRFARGIPIQEAMERPRFHPTGGTLILEVDSARSWGWPGGIPGEIGGLEVDSRPTSTYFARLNAVGLEPASEIAVGVADPRWPWGGALGTAQGGL
jgi:gamma-glutamyltranspeptidase/glutathione hydrolase